MSKLHLNSVHYTSRCVWHGSSFLLCKALTLLAADTSRDQWWCFNPWFTDRLKMFRSLFWSSFLCNWNIWLSCVILFFFCGSVVMVTQNYCNSLVTLKMYKVLLRFHLNFRTV